MIVHGLAVHSSQPGDGGVQVISLSLFGGSHCRVTLHNSTVAVTIVGSRATESGATYVQEINTPCNKSSQQHSTQLLYSCISF